MVYRDARILGQICFKVAKQQNSHALVQSYLNTGVSPSDLLEQAKNHRVLALLAKMLHDMGITQDQVEKKPVFYLLRHAKLRAQLQELDNALHQQNHKVVLIKGAIQLFRSTYPHAGMRDMADIDVLINDATVLKVFIHLGRSEEHTSELQSCGHIVFRLLL